MSFLERAKQAASQAAEQAKAAADQARQSVAENSEKASAVMNDPATAEKARQAFSRAKRGVATAIDRIDPGVLADVIIKATALQERANSALKAKGSPYRISEVGIGASIPPSVTFAIARTDDPDVDVVPDGAVSSTTLVAEVAASANGEIQALDGTALDETALSAEDR
jgi:hypothetical protein